MDVFGIMRSAAPNSYYLRCPSLRQVFAGLLAHHVFGVPVGPVRIGGADAFLVLAVSGGSATHGVGQILRRSERRRRLVNAAGQPGGDLLEQPTVSVRITERGERAVAAMLGVRTADPMARKQVR